MDFHRDGTTLPKQDSFLRLLKELFNEPFHDWLTLYSEGETKTFSTLELKARVEAYWSYFKENDLKKGDTVVIILKESLDLYASFFAALSYGAFPAYFFYPSPKQTEKSFVEAVKVLFAQNSIQMVITYGGVLKNLVENFYEADCDFCNYLDVRGTKDDAGFFPTESEEAFLQFSSGTTGSKKGVLISVQALFNQVGAYLEYSGLDRNSRIISWLPHYHDMGLIACMLMPTLLRVPTVMLNPFEWVSQPRILFDLVKKFKGTHLWLPNFALGHLSNQIDDSELETLDLSSIKKIICCSEMVLSDTITRFLGKFARVGLNESSMNNCYAMAENTFAVSSTLTGPMRFHKGVACAGTPLKNCSLQITGESGQELPDESMGEIRIKTDCMLECYQGNPEETARAMQNGWYNTGDLGFLYKGELYVTGRKKDLIIVGGENIYPQDIELILNNTVGLIPGRNVAFGVPDDRVGTEKIVLLAETKEALDQVDVSQVRKDVTAQLSVAVSDLVLLPHKTLIKGTAGKISRHLNKQAYLKGEYTNKTAQVESSSKVKESLFRIVKDSLKDSIKEDTDLFQEGYLDSFSFLELIQALEKNTGVKVQTSFQRFENFKDIRTIEKTILILKAGDTVRLDSGLIEWNKSREKFEQQPYLPAVKGRWVETLINQSPFLGSWYYRILFRLLGIHVGKNIQFLGKVFLKVRGKPSNIRIEDNVILGKNVDLRNREEGTIILRERSYLDNNVRLVAARQGSIEIGFGTDLSSGTIVNSGGNTKIGKFCLIAANCVINSSSHGTEGTKLIKDQAHTHGTVTVGDDVWLGANVTVVMNSKIGDGAIVSANSLVSGKIAPFTVSSGVPAKYIRSR